MNHELLICNGIRCNFCGIAINCQMDETTHSICIHTDTLNSSFSPFIQGFLLSARLQRLSAKLLDFVVNSVTYDDAIFFHLDFICHLSISFNKHCFDFQTEQ